MPSKAQVVTAMTVVAVLLLYQMIAPRVGLPTI